MARGRHIELSVLLRTIAILKFPYDAPPARALYKKTSKPRPALALLKTTNLPLVGETILAQPNH